MTRKDYINDLGDLKERGWEEEGGRMWVEG